MFIHDMSGGNFLASALGNRLGNFLHFGTSDEKGNVKHVVSESLENRCQHWSSKLGIL
jgi:hypothetical protein